MKTSIATSTGGPKCGIITSPCSVAQVHALSEELHSRTVLTIRWSTIVGHTGGQGCVWMDRDEWLEWGELCKGFEDQVFGDQLGVWGQEDSGTFEAPV
jgi:hypothetical protein